MARSKKVLSFLKKGNSSIILYIVCMWFIVLGCVAAVEYYNAYSKTSGSQLLADIIADGAVFIGNNGWGINTEKADAAAASLNDKNKKVFEDTTFEGMRYYVTGKDGQLSSDVDNGSSHNNTGTAKVKTNAKGRSAYSGTITKTNEATSKIAYTGGLRIVLEAWRHTYEYVRDFNPNAHQTEYVYGAAHGIPYGDSSWENTSDCSSFVSGVFRKCGYNIPSSAVTGTLQNTGRPIAEDYPGLYANARPGDIILYWYDSGSEYSAHVVIYAGEYKGTHYVIENRGGTENLAGKPGNGLHKGVHINELRPDLPKIRVRRIVDSDTTPEVVPEMHISGLSDTQAEIYFMLKELGFSDCSAAGVIGNFMGESGCVPTAREGKALYSAANADYASMIRNGQISMAEFVNEGHGRMGHIGSEGYGIAQWTTTDWNNPYGDRKAKLWEFAEAMGSNVADIKVQTCFAVHEMQQNINGFNFETYKSISDPYAAAEYFMRHYEGIVNSSLSTRQATAAGLYSFFTGHPVAMDYSAVREGNATEASTLLEKEEDKDKDKDKEESDDILDPVDSVLPYSGSTPDINTIPTDIPDAIPVAPAEDNTPVSTTVNIPDGVFTPSFTGSSGPGGYSPTQSGSPSSPSSPVSRLNRNEMRLG